MWYTLYIKDTFSDVIVRYARVENKWDLFAYIGYIYSTSITKIERISYTETPENTYIEPNKILPITIKESFRRQ